MSAEGWMRTHKGDHVRTVGMVWVCEDDDCRCSQAQVVSYYRNLVAPHARVPVLDWEGEFHTDGELGADAELAAYRRELKAEDPEREAAITWQQGVDYDAEGTP